MSQQSEPTNKNKTSTTRTSIIVAVVSLAIALVSIILVIIMFIASNQRDLITKYNTAYSDYIKTNKIFEEKAIKILSNIDADSANSKQYRRNIYYRDCFEDTDFFDEPYVNPKLIRVEDFDNISDEELTDRIAALVDKADKLKQFTNEVNNCKESFLQTYEQIDSKMQDRFSLLYSSEYQAKQKQQAQELSKKYFKTFSKYKSHTSTFDNKSYGLQTKDIKVGNGRMIKHSRNGGDVNYDNAYAAYYIGWLSNGVIFDSSFDNIDNPTELNSPLNGSSSMIQGWLDGIEGMKIGGIREITIPASMGYGNTEQGQIPANSTLKFIIMLIEKPNAINISDELEDLGIDLYGGYSIRGNN